MSQLTDCTNSLTARDILRGAARTGPPFYINVLGLGGLCDEYAVVFAAMTNQPTGDDKDRQNALLCNLVDGGFYSIMDCFCPGAIHTNAGGEAQLNWINPGTYDGVLNGGAGIVPSFTAYEGFTGNPASTAYIDTQFAPSAGVNYALDDSSFFIYGRTNADGNYYDIGINDGSNDAWIVPRNANQFSGRVNDGGSLFVNGMTDSSGLWLNSRTASNVRVAYRNGASIGNDAQASVARSNYNFYIFARNNAGSAANNSPRQISMYGMMAGVDNTEQSNLSDILNDYMTLYGKNVY